MSEKQHPNNMEETTKLTNPKDMIGCDKLPLHLWPETATILGALGLLDGALKYGRLNFREAGIRASIYCDAVKRHINAWFEGEDSDPDSGLPHMCHALACLAIIVDADVKGILTDDRMYPTNYREFVKKMTPHVKRLKELHKDKHPKHWTIKDVPEVIDERGYTKIKFQRETVTANDYIDDILEKLSRYAHHPDFTKKFGEFNKKYTSKKKKVSTK